MRIAARRTTHFLSRHVANGLRVSIPERVRSLTKSRFLQNVTVVAGATAIAQIVTFAFSPILTRLYGPEAFGILGVFLALLATAAPLSSLTYNLAIVLPRSDGEARALIKLSFLISFLITSLSALAIAGFHRQIADAIGFRTASELLLLVPIMIPLSATVDVLRHWMVRKKQFVAISRIAVAEALLGGTSKLVVGSIAATAPVLLVLNVLARAFYAVLMSVSARRTLSSRDDPISAGAEIGEDASLRGVAQRYCDFPFFRAPQIWLNEVSNAAPALLLATFVGPAAAGFYIIATRALGLPSSVVAGAVGTVFLPRAAEADHRSEMLRPLILQSTAGLALVGLLPFGLVVGFGPPLFGLVFGPEWVTAGHYAQWLAVMLFFKFINVPSVQAIPILRLQGKLLAYEITIVTLRLASLAAGVLLLKSDVAALALFSISSASAYLWLIIWVVVRSGKHANRGRG
jgi:O-antigen/teichoic acid export membrane protein